MRRTRRAVVIGGTAQELMVLGGTPSPEEACVGPAIVELPGSTVLVEPGWAGRFDADLTLHLERVR